MKIIYVNPDEMIEIRIIKNRELPLSFWEWKSESVNPSSIIIQAKGNNIIGCSSSLETSEIEETD